MGKAPTENTARPVPGRNGNSAVGSQSAAETKILLTHFEMHKSGGVTFYSLRFSQGPDSWVVEKRYSEFLRCHVQLLESFRRDDLPHFPPKEPVMQKIFGRGGTRVEWAEERRTLLHQYLLGLLGHAGASQSEPLLKFVQAPPPQQGLKPRGGTVTISGVRVRLTGEPGGIEVVVRAEAVGVCSVRLALRQLPTGPDGELPVMPDLTDFSLENMEAWDRWLELELAESEIGGSSEAAYRFSLEPGSVWVVGAVGVNSEGITGNAVCIQLRAPTEVEMAQLPNGPQRSGEKPSDSRPAAEGAPEEVEEAEVWAEAGAPRQDEGDAAAQSGGSSPPRAEVWAVTHTKSTRDHDVPMSSPRMVITSPNHKGEQRDSLADLTEPDLSSPERPGAAGHAKADPGAKSKLPAKRISVESARRLQRGPEVHKVISFQGQAALEYARGVEESQREWMERVPHRFETNGDGKRCSVQARLSVVGKKDAAPLERRRPAAEQLDRGRQAQQQMRDQEEQRWVAAWIYTVTGDARAQAAAQGHLSLSSALETGEALCDLVNAVWPGQIVGILRGDVKPHRRISNVTRFLQACSDLGIRDIFTPPDLAEGKNVRSIVRCLLALAGEVPPAPSYTGPRLEDTAIEVPPGTPEKGSSQNLVASGESTPDQSTPERPSM